jgi:hypothetical protein
VDYFSSAPGSALRLRAVKFSEGCCSVEALPRLVEPEAQRYIVAGLGWSWSIKPPVWRSGSRKFVSDRLSFPGQNRSKQWKYTGKYRFVPPNTGKYRDKFFKFFCGHIRLSFFESQPVMPSQTN